MPGCDERLTELGFIGEQKETESIVDPQAHKNRSYIHISHLSV